MVSESYKKRLYNYLQWRTMEPIGLPDRLKDFPDDPESGEGLTADEAMFEFETNGKRVPCWQPKLLYSYQSGKSLRDFYVSNWVKDVEQGLFVAEEFVCTGGMNLEEFRKVFKRDADPWLLRRMWRDQAKAES